MRVRDEHLDGSRVRSLLGRVSYVLVRDVELVVGYEHGGLYFYDGVVAAVAAVVVMMADETNEEMCTEADEAMERGGGGVNVERNETSEKIQRLRRRERDTDTQIQSQDLPKEETASASGGSLRSSKRLLLAAGMPIQITNKRHTSLLHKLITVP